MSQENATLKTITLTNNTAHTLYPFLEDVNVGKNPNIPAGGNPYYDYTTGTPGGDVADSEYRLYAGYTTKVKGVETAFLGVLPNTTITMTVPARVLGRGNRSPCGEHGTTRARFLGLSIPVETQTDDHFFIMSTTPAYSSNQRY